MSAKQMVCSGETDDVFEANRPCVWGKQMMRFDAIDNALGRYEKYKLEQSKNDCQRLEARRLCAANCCGGDWCGDYLYGE